VNTVVDLIQQLIAYAALFGAGYALGFAQGKLEERKRRDKELEDKVWARLQAVSEANPEIWETEIDA